MIRKEELYKWFEYANQIIGQNKDYLTQLDSAIGDADHGLNISRGFEKIQEKTTSIQSDDLGEILKQISLVLMKSVGGASGSLYGSMFLKMSSDASKKTELTDKEFIQLLQVGVKAITDRGKATLGDKTMIDVWVPSVQLAMQEVEKGKTLKETMKQVVEVAQQNKDNTKDMVAKKGRASYLGDRSAGHIDPGATSAFYLIQALEKAL